MFIAFSFRVYMFETLLQNMHLLCVGIPKRNPNSQAENTDGMRVNHSYNNNKIQQNQKQGCHPDDKETETTRT